MNSLERLAVAWMLACLATWIQECASDPIESSRHKEPLDCRHRPDGLYPNPRFKCSSVFVICRKGWSWVGSCNYGFAFDAVSQFCLVYQKVASCQMSPMEPKSPHIPNLVNMTGAVGKHTMIDPETNFSCSGRPDGYYADPSKSCSTVFYTCSGENGFHKFGCPTNDTFFDTFTNRCQIAEYTTGCGGKPFSVTTHAPNDMEKVPDDIRQLPKTPVFGCEGRSDGIYRHPKANCSQVFFGCENGFAKILLCPPGSRFDAPSGTCTSTAMADGCSGQSSTGNNKLTKARRLFACNATTRSGLHANPRHSCSGLLFGCFNGSSAVQMFQCPPGMRYHVRWRACVEKTRVPACNMPKPGEADIRNESAKISCHGDGNYADPSEACSKHFFSCVGSVVIKQSCPHGTRFDSVTKSCQNPMNVDSCGGTSLRKANETVLQTDEPPTEPALSVTSRLPDHHLVLDCKDRIGNFPDERRNCSQFFFTCTAASESILMKCPGDTVYNHYLNRCTFRAQANDCQIIDQDAANVRTQSSAQFYPAGRDENPVFDVKFRCPGVGNYPDPRAKCSKIFLTCINTGQFIVTYCAKNTFYDAYYDQCFLYEDVPACTGETRPTTLTPSPTQSVPSTQPPFLCRSDGNYAPPGNSCPSWFWQCANGLPYVTHCPGSQRYDAANDWCAERSDIVSCR
jgi:hypothetical protein